MYRIGDAVIRGIISLLAWILSDASDYTASDRLDRATGSFPRDSQDRPTQ